jgi:uncharacterized protein (TIGR02266 family)
MSIEQRQFTRKDISLLVTYEAVEDFIDDYTANVSVGGCFIRTQNKFVLGETIGLSLSVPFVDNTNPDHPQHTTEIIETKAVVRWVSDNRSFTGVGLQFVVLSASDRAKIERLVST